MVPKVDSILQKPNTRSNAAIKKSPMSSQVIVINKLRVKTPLQRHWSEMPESPGFKFSDIQDVVLINIILKNKAHLAKPGQKQKTFHHVFQEYRNDAVSAPIISDKHLTSNVLQWRLVLLIRYRIQFLSKKNNGKRSNGVLGTSRDSIGMKGSHIQEEKTRLIDRVLRERKAEGFPPPVKNIWPVKKKPFLQKNQRRSQAEVSNDDQDHATNNYTESISSNVADDQKDTVDEIGGSISNGSAHINACDVPPGPDGHDDQTAVKANQKRSRSVSKRVRFIEDHRMDDNNTVDRAQSEKRRRFAKNNTDELDNIQSSSRSTLKDTLSHPQSSSSLAIAKEINDTSSTARPSSSLSTTKGTGTTAPLYLSSPSTLPLLQLSLRTASPLTPTWTSNICSSSVLSPLDSTLSSRSVPRYSAVAPPLKDGTPFRPIYHRGRTSIGRMTELNELGTRPSNDRVSRGLQHDRSEGVRGPHDIFRDGREDE